MELIINENVYNFRFGIGFVRYLDGKASVKQDGVTFGIGLETLLPNLLSKNYSNFSRLFDCSEQNRKNNSYSRYSRQIY